MLGLQVGWRSPELRSVARRVTLLLAAACGVLLSITTAHAQTDLTVKLPGAAKEADTSTLLASERVRALPDSARRAWESYVVRSRNAQATDRALLDGELRLLGATVMTRGAFLSKSFDYDGSTKDAWFAGDSARRMTESMLSYQTPSGGWSKHIDFNNGVRQSGQSFFSENEKWQYIATIDNNATTSELRFLMQRERVHPDERVRSAVRRGVEYLLSAQFPSGCWPQVWPLQGGYHDAATFNDDAIVEVMTILDEAARGRASYLSSALRRASAVAVQRGVRCVLDAQVRVDGVLTVWGQQHDPISLAPTSARSYELTSLTSKESAGVFAFLMAHDTLDARIPGALDAASVWFERTVIREMRSEGKNGLVADTNARPLWARMYEIGTNRPIFSNRDGIKLYDFNALTDRREGYGWYSDLPGQVLTHYQRWLAARQRNPSRAREKGKA